MSGISPSTPFVPLSTPRSTDNTGLPDDLAEFYRHSEGIGLEAHPDNLIRLCTLEEVERIGWSDLHVIGGSEPEEGWEQFSGYRIGTSSFFDEIVYVLDAPSCRPGSILVIGVDIYGPGGDGPSAFECSLVLAASFEEWIDRLKQANWIELGVIPGELENLQPADRQASIRYYQSLNPKLEWEWDD